MADNTLDAEFSGKAAWLIKVRLSRMKLGYLGGASNIYSHMDSLLDAQVPFNIARVWRPLCEAAMASDKKPGESSSAPAMLGILHIAEDGPEHERVSATRTR